MKLCLTFLTLIIFSFIDSVSAISFNGYEVEEEIINECNSLNYQYYHVFHENPSTYTFTCSYYPVTFQSTGSSWGKNFYYHTIYDNNGSFVIQNDGLGIVYYDDYYKAYTKGLFSKPTTRHKGLSTSTETDYSNHDIYNYYSDKTKTSSIYHSCNADSCISSTEILGPTYENNYIFTNSFITTLYGIDYITTSDISDKISISFKYDGENEPVFNGVVTYGLKNYNGLYNWTIGMGYSSIEDTGLTVGEYTETYKDNIYTLTLDNIRVEDLNNEYEKIIVRFEFLWANYISDISIKNDYLDYSNFNFNSFGYDYIIDNFNTDDFTYLNFTTTLEEYRDTMYLIGTANSISPNLIFSDYFSTKNYKFISYGDIYDVYNNELYGYNHLKQFIFNIGTSSNTGFWLTRNLTDDMEGGNGFNFSIAYKMNQNLYFSYNTDYENLGATITDGVDENGSPNIVITDITISDDVATPEDYKDFFTIATEFLNDLKDTRNLINDLYNHFYNSLPSILKGLHNFILIVLCLIIFIKVGVEQ